MRRGEIYYITNRGAVGSEIMKDRPAIIVSNNHLNDTSEVVEVVYLTSQPKRDMATHVTINATGRRSTALCEQIGYVSTELIDNYVATCTAEEMRAIDAALLVSLGINTERPTSAVNRPHNDMVNHPSHYTTGRIEVIDFIEDKELSFSLGNAVKYIARAGKKDPTKTGEDLQKAAWYLAREIKQLEGETG